MSIFTFDNQTFTLTNYGTTENIFFKAKEIASFLAYTNTRKAIRDHVWDANKFTLDENHRKKGGVDSFPPPNEQMNTIYINEAGLYQLIFRSQMPCAEQFQKWVFDVLASIRKTGKYKNNENNKIVRANLTFKIETEYDLHKQLVNFLRVQYPNVLLTICNPELSNDTSEKRIKSYLLGYTVGTFDILINNLHKNYSGFAIELKSPKGTGIISDAQQGMQSKYAQNNFKTLISNDYNQIIVEIIEYMREVRIKCNHCKTKFKNNQTLGKHLLSFHKINR